MAKFSLVEVFGNSDLGFRGNTASVVQLNEALSDETMQLIAADFNQPATTFLWTDNNGNTQVRWFAPDGEIGLCGHGTLAALALAPFNKEQSLQYRTGTIKGSKLSASLCEMFITPIYSETDDANPVVAQGLGKQPVGYYKNSNKHIVLLATEDDVRAMRPDFAKLRTSEVFGYVVTAPGKEVDFVSRTIVPHVQQLEDHATGSSHAALTPFWAKKLNKKQLKAYQLSKRGGLFTCEIQDSLVSLKGEYRIFAEGELNL